MTSHGRISKAGQRRSLRYIRLAAYFASLDPSVIETVLSVDDIEELLDRDLPQGARFPTWWRNDVRRMHSRAWLAAGWAVSSVDIDGGSVTFQRGNQIVLD